MTIQAYQAFRRHYSCFSISCRSSGLLLHTRFCQIILTSDHLIQRRTCSRYFSTKSSLTKLKPKVSKNLLVVIKKACLSLDKKNIFKL